MVFPFPSFERIPKATTREGPNAVVPVSCILYIFSIKVLLVSLIGFSIENFCPS